jgi:hypothetical protein
MLLDDDNVDNTNDADNAKKENDRSKKKKDHVTTLTSIESSDS